MLSRQLVSSAHDCSCCVSGWILLQFPVLESGVRFYVLLSSFIYRTNPLCSWLIL